MIDPADLMTGFPPTSDRLVTLENWTEPPQLRWAFQHVRELVPTARIDRGEGPPLDLPRAEQPLGGVAFDDGTGNRITVDAMLEQSFTDGFLVLHRGAIVCERYANGMTPATPHLLQSVSKSICGTVAGITVGRGLLDPGDLVTDHIPELGGGSFAGATVRDVLDMRTGTRYDETYTDPDSDVRITEHLGAWRPPRPGLAATNLYEQISQLENARGHGELFEYRSILSDLLAWVLERAAGLRYPDLVSQELWSRIGAEHDAEITVHRGVVMADGGISATLRDLGRFGLLHLGGGELDGQRIVPEGWILDTRHGDDSARSAFERGRYRDELPGWIYRNQWWVEDPERGIAMARGIHGQTIWVHPGAEVVCVKLSTWPTALDDDLGDAARRAFHAIAEHLTA